MEESDHRHRRLLRTRSYRPRCRRAAAPPSSVMNSRTRVVSGRDVRFIARPPPRSLRAALKPSVLLAAALVLISTGMASAATRQHARSSTNVQGAVGPAGYAAPHEVPENGGAASMIQPGIPSASWPLP